MNRQLYKYIKDVGSTSDNYTHGFYSFIWPNGVPCLSIEMYLMDKSKEVNTNKKDGGTLGSYAKNLTHLVRYCYLNKIDFIDFTHKNMDDFILMLTSETDIFNQRVRNNNTVRRIIQTSIGFLVWIQSHLAMHKNIAGVDNKTDRYQIKLVKSTHSHRSGITVEHSAFPSKLPKAITANKRPISSDNIKMLWNALDESRKNNRLSNKLKSIFSLKQQKEHIEYMYKRRELQLILLEATGLRPQELVSIECLENLKRLKDSQLCIPTLKGRVDSRENKRVIPIPRHLAMKIELFIFVHRERLIKRLLKAKIINDINEVSDIIYLNAENGSEVLPDAAYQEFRRLTVKAGIVQKNCQSMFRHRFITNMVKIHLMGFMDKNPLKNRQIITDNDYRTILKKVASFTGHKNLDSLMHYIDLAWDELDSFSYTYEVKELQEKLKAIFYLTHEIKSNIINQSTREISKSSKELLINKLNEIEDCASNI
ncbi:site-specific integrase [Marinicella sp. S1101]|nr:site-specific integrase [Marinicella marina]